MHFGWVEILILVAIVVLLFGARRIPELMRGAGRGVREFKDELHGRNDSEPRKGKKQ